MKKLYIYLLAGILATATSCTYTFPEDELPTAGTADFTKVVAVGNSLTAGYMDGALYDAGQAASFANIIAQQIHSNGGGEFNQPDIKARDGDYGGTSGGAAGRLHLVDPANPAPTPIIPGQPITPYSGGKSLNNFGVPGMRIVDFETVGYGSGAGNIYFNRFATSDATTVMADATAAGGTFFTFWLGSNDVLGYALGGATNPAALTSVSDFTNAYGSAITAMTANGANGILANIPSINDIPHFTTVTWDAIEFDPNKPESQPTVDALNDGFEGLNSVLDVLYQPPFNLDSTDMVSRKVSYNLGKNPILIFDGNLLDIGPYLDMLEGAGEITPEEKAKLQPYRQSRPLDNTVLVTLSAGSVLGTLADPDNPQSVIGAAVPLQNEDLYTLTDEEQNDIADRIAEFNTIIASEVTASNGNLVLMDMNAEFLRFSTEDITINGAGVDTSIVPPFGLFSLDGIHPNQRGSAYVASLFIDKINEAFGANIPNINPNNWPGNELPVP